jgi:PKD repeat protein/photosystem II stability/assembly factor-like uncharacterized protein
MKNILTIILLSCSTYIANGQTANWKLTGPIKFPTNKTGQVNGMGRVSQIAFHPTDPNKMYAASASGGVYISTDGGKNWAVTGTDKLADMSCASLCVDYTDDKIIYLGSGDANYYGTSFGIWKSIDAGATWKLSNSGIGNRMALDILMNPSNNQTLIAATNDGIWKSTDAGATWTVKKSGGDFKMMKFNSANSNIIYAVTSTQFFRSTDMGDTWTAITLPASNSGGGRIGVTKADASRVYVTFVGDYANSKATPVYKSTDGGLTFTTVHAAGTYNMNGYDETQSGQGNYNYGMTVDPGNANLVWICGHCIFKSTDGGTTWARQTSWAIQMHTDMHQLIYSPHDATKLFNANDGGVWINTDALAGVKWAPSCDGLSSTECYHAGQSPIKKDRIGCGTQDNGEIYYDATTWNCNRGGDWGSVTSFDYQNTDWIYYMQSGKRRIGLTGGDQNLVLPFTASNAAIIEFTPLSKNTAFLAGNDVYRTDNLTTNPPTWNKISSINEVIKALTISPADANIVYAVTTSGKVYRSDNALSATASFANVSTAPSASNSKASIAVIKSSPNTVYMSCNSKVYRSTDKGVTWTAISTGLPATNFIKIYNDIYSTDESVYIANGVSAVYYKNINLTSWANYSKGLPTIASVTDFMIFNDGNYNNSVLRLSYYGRGVWETGLYKVAQIPVANFTADKVQSCDGVIQFTDISTNSPTSWAWDFGDTKTSTLQNPLHTYASSGTYTVKLTATNSIGPNQVTKTSYVKVQILPSPSTTGDSRCGAGVVNLNGTGLSGNTLNWYTSATGGNYLTSGTVYAPNLTNTTTFYVEQTNAGPLQKVGPADSTMNGGGYYASGNFDGHGIVFDVSSAVKIKTVKVYSDSAYSRVIQVLDTIGGNVVASKTVAIPVGASRITLDFSLPPKNNYFMKVTGTSANIHLYRNNNGPYAYPYKINGLVSLKQSEVVGSETKLYYYFYDWEVQTDGCTSSRVAVTGTIHSIPVTPTITQSSGTLTANPSGYTYQWYFGGNIIAGAINQTYKPTQTGNYTVEIKDANGCTASSVNYYFVSTAINDISTSTNFNLFPNPANNEITIELYLISKNDVSVEIVDVLGKQVMNESYKNIISGNSKISLDLQNLMSGIYYIKVNIDGRQGMQKLIINK